MKTIWPAKNVACVEVYSGCLDFTFTNTVPLSSSRGRGGGQRRFFLTFKCIERNLFKRLVKNHMARQAITFKSSTPGVIMDHKDSGYIGIYRE